jgi:hypothetical protein
MSGKPDYRGFVNPVPGISQGEQKELMAKYGPSDVYTIAKGVGREDFIKQLRKSRVALVAWTALLAKRGGTKESRYADLMEAKDDIHARGSHIREAATGLRSDRPADWRKMRAAAGEMLGRLARSAKNPIKAARGSPPLNYSNQELSAMLVIVYSPDYTNYVQRAAAIKKAGIKVPSRTWLTQWLKRIARDRGLVT